MMRAQIAVVSSRNLIDGYRLSSMGLLHIPRDEKKRQGKKEKITKRTGDYPTFWQGGAHERRIKGILAARSTPK